MLLIDLDNQEYITLIKNINSKKKLILSMFILYNI